MAKLIHAMSGDGSVMALAIRSTDIASRIEQIHKTSAVVTAALGRLATAASMMGVMLKGEGDSLTLRVDGGGPAGTLIAVADSAGCVKAYVQNPVVELPLNARGKLDVAGAVGREGYLSVIKDLGLKEPYSGQVPLISGELAEDVTNYYATSEQTPTSCGLGVLVNPALTVRAAGGFLVQLLPNAADATVERLEQNVRAIPPVSSLIDRGMEPEEICRMLLEGLDPVILDEFAPEYRCDCSRERVERAVLSLGKDQLDELISEDHGTEVSCHFCGKAYRFSEEELRALRDRAVR